MRLVPWKFLLIVVVVLFIAAGIYVVWLKVSHDSVDISPQNQGLPTSGPSEPLSTPDNTKIYRNEEWGFEFKYPGDWIIQEKPFGGFYSKFNLVVAPSIGEAYPPPILINVVLPEFADNTFRSVETVASEANVDEVSGIKYEYYFEGVPEIAIVLPHGGYRVILATKRKYEGVFNQFISTFKFLR